MRVLVCVLAVASPSSVPVPSLVSVGRCSSPTRSARCSTPPTASMCARPASPTRWRRSPRCAPKDGATSRSPASSASASRPRNRQGRYEHAAAPVSYFRVWVRALCAIGLRIDEACRARRSDVDLVAGCLRVGHAKTPAGVRSVQLTPDTAAKGGAPQRGRRAAQIDGRQSFGGSIEWRLLTAEPSKSATRRIGWRIGPDCRSGRRLSRKSGCRPAGLRPFGDGTELRRV